MTVQAAEISEELEREGSVALPSASSARDSCPDPRISDLASRWIDEMIRTGGRSGAAALAAGYSPSGAEGMGIRNLANKRLQAELVRRLMLQHGSMLAVAAHGYLRIIQESKDDKAVVMACNALSDRFGLPVKRAPLVAIQNNVVSGETAQQIIAEVHAARSAREAA